MIPINRNPSEQQLRQFAFIVLPVFVALFGGLIWWRTGALSNAIIVWLIGAVVAIGAMVRPASARMLFVGLQVITYPIGLVLSTIVLAAMFYLVFTPLGVLMRLAGRDPLHLRAREAASNWTPYKQKDDPQDAFRQY